MTNIDKCKIIFALGSNLGNRYDNINNAIILLEKSLNLVNIRRSTIIENKAILLPNSPSSWDKDFLNIVISADFNYSKYDPISILQITQNIECKIGRKKSQRWSPREIDIDILAINNYVINIDHRLSIPHIGLKDRSFFKNGFKEIEPELYQDIFNKL